MRPVCDVARDRIRSGAHPTAGKPRFLPTLKTPKGCGGNKKLTHCEIVDTIRDGLAAEFDAQSVFSSVFDGVVDAEGAVAVVLDIDVHVAAESKSQLRYSGDND